MKKAFIILCLAAFSACSKEKSEKHCWELVDCAGNIMEGKCDMTEGEINQYISTKYPSSASCIKKNKY
ncbi:hypothetical protein JMG10_07790 [Nostoc ellipsosporum NOK]|nr:hypothetical protein [Nostoc ellipsosporum NOK]